MKRQEKDGIVWYEGEVFSSSVLAGFSTCLGGTSQGKFATLNLGVNRGDDVEAVRGNYEKLCNTVGVSSGYHVRNAQVHGAEIHVVGKEEGLNLEDFTNPNTLVSSGDGLLTDDSALCLWVYGADCVPVLFHDPVKKVIGVVHAGWRGTVAGICEKMVEKMGDVFGSLPKDIEVVLGPSIGACCFTCSNDVKEAVFQSLGEEAVELFCPPHKEEEGKFSVDLWGLNVAFLKRSGVLKMEVSGICTACNGTEFWSHRVLGEERGVQAGFISLKGGKSL